jgi:hypothetical protein
MREREKKKSQTDMDQMENRPHTRLAELLTCVLEQR